MELEALLINDYPTICPIENNLWNMIMLTLKHRETHGCVVSTVATDALVLKHQAISILRTDYTFNLLDQFHMKILYFCWTTFGNKITYWENWPSRLRVKSPLLRVQCGVAKGSYFGPLLFLIYINELALYHQKLFAVLFARDSIFFCTGKDIYDLIYIVNNELVDIVDWFNANKMSLNIEKIHFL